MESICIRVDSDFAKDVERAMKRHRYSTKTELVREALRDKIRDLERSEALARASKAYGAGKGKHTISDADLHRARERAVAELEGELQ
ncbi:MAG: ribbon-helix-helix domain-containing protein [Nanoarchaeota archaeon]